MIVWIIPWLLYIVAIYVHECKLRFLHVIQCQGHPILSVAFLAIPPLQYNTLYIYIYSDLISYTTNERGKYFDLIRTLKCETIQME